MTLVAILDDEPDIRELITLNMEKAGFGTRSFSRSETLLKYLEKNIPDVLILDLMLPDKDGIDVCKFIRSKKTIANLPIIMLTARVEESDKIVGLELGADDYVTKPFSPKELVARVKAILRRKCSNQTSDIVQVGDAMVINPQKYQLLINGEEVELTTTEFKLLHMLSENKGVVFSRAKILDRLWGNDKVVFDRTVDVHINHLREKLGVYADYIKNIRGVGYKLEWK